MSNSQPYVPERTIIVGHINQAGEPLLLVSFPTSPQPGVLQGTAQYYPENIASVTYLLILEASFYYKEQNGQLQWTITIVAGYSRNLHEGPPVASPYHGKQFHATLSVSESYQGTATLNDGVNSFTNLPVTLKGIDVN